MKMIIGEIDGKKIEKKISIKYEERNISPDKIVKLSLLTVLVGYLKGGKIKIDKPLKVNNRRLSSFLNFILNHRKFAPIKYNIKVEYSNNFHISKIKNKKNKKGVVILGSGGIDSTGAILHYLDKGIKPVVVFLHFGQINNDREIKIIRKICDKLKINLAVAKINISKEVLRGWKEWSYIVPARNFLISSTGALVLNEIFGSGELILAATQEEVNHPQATTDKSKRFYNFCSEFYSLEYGVKIKVITPFIDITKAELLSVWRRKWVKKYNISPYGTSTCYKGIECGKCNSCFKRSIALLAGGLNLDKQIKVNPFYDEKKSIDYLKRMASPSGNFTKKRRLDTIIGYIQANRIGLIKSNRLRKEIMSLKRDLSSQINQRTKELFIRI